MKTLLRTLLVTALAATPALAQTGPNAPNEPVGQHYLITKDDLPAPYATESVSNSGDLKPIPGPLVLNLPEGFTVNLFATGFDHARWLATAPNGDIFLAESRENRIVVLRDADGDGVPDEVDLFSEQNLISTGGGATATPASTDVGMTIVLGGAASSSGYGQRNSASWRRAIPVATWYSTGSSTIASKPSTARGRKKRRWVCPFSFFQISKPTVSHGGSSIGFTLPW